MGGSRSGRHGGRPTIEATAAFVLSAAILKRLSPGSAASASGSVTYAGGFKVDFRFAGAGAGGPYIELRHTIRAQDEREIRYRVDLVATCPSYGGLRWWWVCPRTGRRAFKLYLPLGGLQFWSRRAYGLDYASQRETPRDRMFRRARKLQLAIDRDCGPWDTPQRPKWMRQHTYRQRLRAWLRLETHLDEVFCERAERLLGLT